MLLTYLHGSWGEGRHEKSLGSTETARVLGFLHWSLQTSPDWADREVISFAILSRTCAACRTAVGQQLTGCGCHGLSSSLQPNAQPKQGQNRLLYLLFVCKRHGNGCTMQYLAAKSTYPTRVDFEIHSTASQSTRLTLKSTQVFWSQNPLIYRKSTGHGGAERVSKGVLASMV